MKLGLLNTLIVGVIFLTCTFNLKGQSYLVSTFAGTGIPGSNNSTRLTATFTEPIGLALDNKGNLLVSENQNNTIRLIGINQDTVFNLLNPNNWGFADGNLNLAKFNTLAGITTLGNQIFVSDEGNKRVREIIINGNSGNATTIAGTGRFGYDDGPRNVATFRDPAGLTTDSAGNLIVADKSNHVIRLINRLGTVNTLAGTGTPGILNGPANNAQFTFPRGVVCNRDSGFIYVSDGSHKIRVIKSNGVVSVFAGIGQAGCLPI